MYVCMYVYFNGCGSIRVLYVCIHVCMNVYMYVCIIDCVTIIAATIPGIGREKSGTSNSPGEVDIITFFS